MWRHSIPRTRGMSPAEAAAHWVVRDDARELTATEEAEFASWCADPANAQAYRKATGAMALFDGDLGADQNLRALRQAALEAAPAPGPRFRLAGALIAASLVGAITLIGVSRSGHGPASPARPPPTAIAQAPAAQRPSAAPTEYDTDVGERRAVRLADGTMVTLNTGTRLTIAFTDARRVVRLVRGQALFEVAHDRSRPFTVEAADRQITALGTVFEVRVDPGRVNVVLVEGRVMVDRTPEAARSFQSARITPTMLRPGEEFSAELGAPQRIASVNVERQLLWRDGFVEFDDEPLGLAVAEINRYTSRPITLSGDGIAALHVSGLFRTGSPDQFVDAIDGILPIDTKPAPHGGIELSLTPQGRR